MKSLKAIETRYKGYRFRSRLEARWAVFFDALGIEWQYEPEGFVLDDGTQYLPDFYLPSLGLWVEVKHENSTGEDAQKACQFAFSCNNRVWLAKGLPSQFDGKFLYAYRDEEIGEAFFDWGLTVLARNGVIPYDLYATSQRFTGLVGLAKESGNLRPAIKEGTSDTEKEEIQRFASAASPWLIAHVDSFYCDLGLVGFVLDVDEAGVKGLKYAPFHDTEYTAPSVLREAFTSAKSARFEFGEQGARP